jgi:hypothetical protein
MHAAPKPISESRDVLVDDIVQLHHDELSDSTRHSISSNNGGNQGQGIALPERTVRSPITSS